MKNQLNEVYAYKKKHLMYTSLPREEMKTNWEWCWNSSSSEQQNIP